MNIALIHYSAPPVVGGVESVLGQHARLLAGHGHAVRLVAARGSQTDERVPFVRVPLADSQHATLAALKAELDAGRVPGGLAAVVALLEAELRAALKNIEIVIAHNVCSLNKNLALTAALHAIAHGPEAPRFVLWHHDLAWTTPRYRHELHTGYPWELLRTAWPGATQVVVSELRQRELAGLMGLAPEAIRVVPNGIDAARFHKLEAQTQSLVARMQLADAAPILLLPVRITPRKNIELALRVLAALTPRPPLPGGEGEPALIVTGPLGPHNANNHHYFAQLKALRAELGLESRAHFLAELSEAYLPDEVIADFFRLADALILPSREEGFGLPVLEAALTRMPIFCADIEPLHALAGEGATYFSPEADPVDVAAAIAARLQTDDVFQHAVRVRGAFMWESIYQQHLAPLLAEGKT